MTPLALRRILALFSLFASATAGQAFEFVRTNDYVLAQEQSIDDQLVITADSVSIKGNARDDVFIAANQVSLLGAFGNDVWAGGSEITATGSFGDHLRAAGNTIRFQGIASNGVAFAGNSVDIATGSVVQASANIAASACVVAGEIWGPARIMAESVTLSGDFRSSVRVIAGDIVVMPGTMIAGDLRYTSGKEVVLPDGVELGGKLIRESATAAAGPQAAPSWQDVALMQAFFLIAALMAGIPFVAVFPAYAGRAVRTLRTSPLKSAFFGALMFLIVPTFAVVSIVTLIGLPLGLILACLAFCIAYLAKVVVALAVGAFILRLRGGHGFGTSLLALLAGLTVLYVFAALPAIGGAVSMAVVLLGSGALVASLAPGARGPVAPPPMPAQAGGDRSSDLRS